jgi:hypothetical protein
VEALTTKDIWVQMAELGDRHNFGKAVYREESDPNLIFKPRPIYWENLAFGQESPLASIFNETPLHKFFQLQTVVKNNKLYQKFIESFHNQSLNFRDYGFLVGYCFFLGIQDLHAKNVIQTKIGPQPIDIEVIFSDLIAPCQTLLVPGPNIDYSRTPLSLYKPLHQISLEQIKEMIVGFDELFETIKNNCEKIMMSLGSNNIEPIRVIFRDTRDYENNTATDLIEEELLQIKRGDIPYFFKYLNTNEVFYYSTETSSSPVNLIPNFYKKSNIVGINPKILFLKENLENKFPTSLLSLVSSFHKQFDNDFILQLRNGHIETMKNKVILTSNNRKIILNLS